MNSLSTTTTRNSVLLVALIGFLAAAGCVDARVGESRHPTAPAALDNKGARRLQALQDVVGNNGSPASVYPLGECQGDCDNDGECGDGLFCLQRSPGDPVPGCSGDMLTESDFCVADVLGAETTAPTMGGTAAATMAQTMGETTMGPTIADSTMAPTDAMTQASTTMAPTDAMTQASTTMAPTNEATEAATSAATSSSTIGPTAGAATLVPTATNTMEDSFGTNPPTAPIFPLSTVGNDGNFPAFPLSICEGDCDVDDDCIDELICFQRSVDEPVPGCTGTGDFSIDYCVDPFATVLSTSKTAEQGQRALQQTFTPSASFTGLGSYLFTVEPTTMAPTE